ncbi:hypothetical protein ABEB36_006040 [Hypothenemus hampei]|uniref:TM7S3/TM198-like domain-containing protein n=1 Tax=Hypothenemus hampei TaxID=57062 RepID=A0ABD1F1J0_HYPHA
MLQCLVEKMIRSWKCLLYIWILNFCSKVQASTDPEIVVDLNNEQPGFVTNNYQQLSNCSTYVITVLNFNPNVKFFIIQVHSFHENLTLSYENPVNTNSFTSGQNIGLVWMQQFSTKFGSLNNNSVNFYLFRRGTILNNLDILLSVSTYAENDPVPGGCNLSFETEIAPYQKITTSSNTITVLSQPPSIFESLCDRSDIQTDMYFLYLKEHNNNADEYFRGIEQMMSPANITKYGTRVIEALTSTKFKQMYSRYAGTGRVFAIVSTYKNKTSAYVPTVSYSCDLHLWEEDCLGPNGVYWKLVTAFLLVCGLILCFVGHRLFKISLFIIGYTFGVFIMLIVLTVDDDFNETGKTVYALVMGGFFAITWVFLWWKFGVPVIAVELTFLLSGFILSSIIFYSPLGNIMTFATDGTFWILFATIILLLQIPLVCLKSSYNIVALSLIGSYAFVVAMNFYFGGYLPYIFINMYRRMIVKDFGLAVIDPPYEMMGIFYSFHYDNIKF